MVKPVLRYRRISNHERNGASRLFTNSSKIEVHYKSLGDKIKEPPVDDHGIPMLAVSTSNGIHLQRKEKETWVTKEKEIKAKKNSRKRP